MTPLQSRKQLLLAESDLNRAQMAGDLAALNPGLRALADRAKSFGVIASFAAVLVAGLAALPRGQSPAAEPAPSRWKSGLKLAGLISTLWLAFRRPPRDPAGPRESHPKETEFGPG